MRSRNKLERQIVEWSTLLPRISPKQDRWALKHCTDMKAAYSNSSRISHGCFYLITTYKGWQVVRYFQIKAHYAYRTLKKYYYKECMQHWIKDDKYIFLSLPRMQGCINDAFSSGAMEVRREYGHCSLLCDPRYLGYDDVYIARLQKRFQYAWRNMKDAKDNVYIFFRALGASPYCETLWRNHPDIFNKAVYRNFTFNKDLMAAIKIAMRYKYDISSSLWWDMMENLHYLKKDLHNPKLVCPIDIQKAHDKWMKLKLSRMKKMSDKMCKLRQLASEKMELRRIEEQRTRMEEQKEYAKSVAQSYINKRKKFFGLDITDGQIDIKVLQSVEEFYEEGKEMCHCVFANRYFDINKKPYCLILSAKVQGRRVETIEIDMNELKIVQCQGKHNIPSEYHKRIVNLMENNIYKIQELV